jgi:predicted enzyme related to lactoylglutathione lyase
VAYPVVHFEVTGKDIAGLKSFYGKVFEWEFQDFSGPGMPAYAIVEKPEGGIGGGIGESANGPGHVTFYVSVPDPQATLDTAVANGATVVMPVTELPMVTLALFTDPEGHMVGIVKDSDGA